jgi:hypothetical protein
MREGRPLTIMLPLYNEPVNVLKQLYALGKPERLIKFLLMHVVSGKPLLKRGQHFVLSASERQRAGGTRLQVIDEAWVPHLKASNIGTIVSGPMYIAPTILAYMTKFKYGSIDQFANGRDRPSIAR